MAARFLTASPALRKAPLPAPAPAPTGVTPFRRAARDRMQGLLDKLGKKEG
jgi:hypothetical protein